MSEALVTVRLLGLPVGLRRRAIVHDDTLRRELAVVRAGRPAEASARLVELSRQLEDRFAKFTADQRAALDAADEDDTVDVVFDLPPDAADAAERLDAMLDEIDELCRSGELVTLVTPPDAVAYRRWAVTEFVEQIRNGRPPRPWPGFDDEGAVRVTSAEHGTELPPLFIEGDLDLFGAPTLRAAIAERLETGATSIVVDLSHCGFIDSVGLSLLLTTRERCRAAGGTLNVIGAGESALRLFETVGVRHLLVSS